MFTRDALTLAWRYLMLIPAWLLAMSVSAQKTPERDYLLHFGTPVTPVQEKFLQEGVVAQDPGAWLWVDAPSNSALVRIHGQLDREQLQAHLGNCGLQIASMVQVLTAQPGIVVGNDPSVPPMPPGPETH